MTTAHSSTARSDFSRGPQRFLTQPIPLGTMPGCLIISIISLPRPLLCPTAREKVYVADDYSSGRLDWYSLDLDARHRNAWCGRRLREQPAFQPDAPFTTIPIPVSFSGMPNTRWWAFEDHATNFGDIDASTTDLAKLLFMEFALVYSNDWFVIPCTLPSGALAQVQGLAVTNVFGERFGSKPPTRESTTSGAAGACSPSTFATLRPVVPQPTRRCCCFRRSPVLRLVRRMEEVFLVRDEVANMAWGVEKTVALASGISRPGSEVAKQTFNYLQGLIPGGARPLRRWLPPFATRR